MAALVGPSRTRNAARIVSQLSRLRQGQDMEAIIAQLPVQPCLQLRPGLIDGAQFRARIQGADPHLRIGLAARQDG